MNLIQANKCHTKIKVQDYLELLQEAYIDALVNNISIRDMDYNHIVLMEELQLGYRDD